MDQIPTTLRIPWYEKTLELSLSLPFTWQLFFFSAASIALANLVYTIWCPEIIRNYHTFSDFEKEGRGPYQLLELYSNSVLYKSRTTSEREVRESVREFYSSYCVQNETVSKNVRNQSVPLVRILSDLKIQDTSLQGAFWHVRNFMEKVRFLARALCIVLYTIGFMLVSVIALENFATVLKFSGLCPNTIRFCVDSTTSRRTIAEEQASKERGRAFMPDWVQFFGHVIDQTPAFVVLEATDGSRGVIRARTADFRIVGDLRLELRVGTQVELLSPPVTQRQSQRYPNVCNGNGTFCTGKTEYCCDDGKLIGSCENYYRCP